MISQIIQVLDTANKPLSLDMLSNQLTIERSALEAMLNMLVQKGKIQKISPSNTDQDKGIFLCKGCQSQSYCVESMKTPVVYALIKD